MLLIEDKIIPAPHGDLLVPVPETAEGPVMLVSGRELAEVAVAANRAPQHTPCVGETGARTAINRVHTHTHSY